MIAVAKRSELLLLVYGERVNSIKPSLASVRKGWAVRLRASLWAETLPLDHRLVNSKILLILDRWTIRRRGLQTSCATQLCKQSNFGPARVLEKVPDGPANVQAASKR